MIPCNVMELVDVQMTDARVPWAVTAVSLLVMAAAIQIWTVKL